MIRELNKDDGKLENALNKFKYQMPFSKLSNKYSLESEIQTYGSLFHLVKNPFLEMFDIKQEIMTIMKRLKEKLKVDPVVDLNIGQWKCEQLININDGDEQ